MDWKPDFQIQFDGLMRSEVVMPPEKKALLISAIRAEAEPCLPDQLTCEFNPK